MATKDPLLYLLDLDGATRKVTTVRGHEGLSMPWRFEVDLHLEPDDALDPDAVAGAEASLLLSRGSTIRNVRGVVTRIQRRGTRTGDAGGARVRLVLEARLAVARFRTDIRVFRDKTAPQIVAEVIRAHGVDVVDQCAGSYAVRPYCVQLRESDLAFASRLLEDEGIFYVLDDDGRMILGDRPATYGDGTGPIPFKDDSALDAQHDAVFEAGWAGTATAGKVSLRDFNPEHPNLDMDASAAGPTSWGPEWYDYPGEYEAPGEGAAKAKLRAEALACAKHRLSGRTSSARVRPGDKLLLTDAPAGVRDGEYVATIVWHAWDRAKGGFSTTFEAIDASVVYRPLVVTPVPTLTNPLTGFVTGPAGADIHTDAWGRVKVHFPWDRLQPKDDTCSHWVPTLQDNTGRSSAMPRIGWEMLVNFLEGDPDRPVVMGRVFNAADPFTEDLPVRKMRTSLMSLSSPRSKSGPTGFNMIRFDDLSGSEVVDIHAQKDQVITVANDHREQVDAVELRVVEGNEKIKIGAEHVINVQKDYAPKVDGNQKVTIAGSRSAKVKGHNTEGVHGNHTLIVGGKHSRTMGKDDSVGVGKNLRETIGGIVLEGSVKSNETMSGQISVLAVGGAIVEIARVGKEESTDKGRLEAIGGLVFSKAGDSIATRAGTSRTTLVGGAYKVSSKAELLLSGVLKLSTRSLTASLKSPDITLKVGETVVHMKDGVIEMKAKSEISLETSAENKLATSTADQI